jgi:hypothetical protein
MEVHDQEQVFLVVETPPELDHEWISTFACHSLEHSLFGERMLQFLVRKDMSFRNRLQCIQLGRRTVSDQQNLLEIRTRSSQMS